MAYIDHYHGDEMRHVASARPHTPFEVLYHIYPSSILVLLNNGQNIN